MILLLLILFIIYNDTDWKLSDIRMVIDRTLGVILVILNSPRSSIYLKTATMSQYKPNHVDGVGKSAINSVPRVSYFPKESPINELFD